MNADFPYDVFVSHNSADKPRVRRLAERLRAAGLRVWFDEWIIQPGDDIYLAIERGLEASRTLVLCLSPAALGSDWVGLERSTVLFRDPANAGRRFIPLLLADCRLPDTLRRYRYVDLRQQSDAALDELIAACQGTLGRTPPRRDDPRLVARPLNLGFDGAVEEGYPHGWFDSLGFVARVSTDYEVRVVQRDDGQSGRCLILRHPAAGEEKFASVMQRFPAKHLAGRGVRLEGDIKTEDVQGWAGLWLRADGDQAYDLFFDNMSGHSVTGTTHWARYSIDAQLPAATTWLNVGVVFCGSGTVWADNLALRVWTSENRWEDA